MTIDDVIEFFNELVKIDRPATASLLLNRVPCNGDLARHPTVQVFKKNGGQVGLLGILNGLFGTLGDGHGPIGLKVSDDGELEGLGRNVEVWRGTAFEGEDGGKS